MSRNDFDFLSNIHGVIPVCFHEDLCTKNKLMFRIPTLGLFLTCTKNSFFILAHKCTYLSKNAFAYWLKKIKTHLLNKEALLSWQQIFPSTQVPCSKPTAFRPLRFSSPPCSLPTYRAFILHTKMTLTGLIPLLGTIPIRNWLPGDEYAGESISMPWQIFQHKSHVPKQLKHPTVNF
jgi:hypothetical protein